MRTVSVECGLNGQFQLVENETRRDTGSGSEGGRGWGRMGGQLEGEERLGGAGEGVGREGGVGGTW